MPLPIDLQGFLNLAARLADASGGMLRDHWRTARVAAFETKDDASPVTALDRAIEVRMRDLILATFPAHGIVGEEFGAERFDAEFVWVIDPIDGTKQFISGVPVYGTLIGLAHGGSPILGLIDHPITAERWVGAAGRRTTLNGREIATRACERLADALMSCSSPETIPPAERAGFERVRMATKWRLYGAGCYAHASLATGRVDLSVDSGGHREVDYCALVPVVQGAGGTMTDWQGRALTIQSGTSSLLAAGDPRCHGAALDLLNA